MTYMFILKCALKLVEEIILYYDARSKKHQNVNYQLKNSLVNLHYLRILLVHFICSYVIAINGTRAILSCCGFSVLEFFFTFVTNWDRCIYGICYFRQTVCCFMILCRKKTKRSDERNK